MEGEQLVSLRMIVCGVATILLSIVALIAENIPIILVVMMIVGGIFAGFMSVAFKSAGRFFISYGVLFFMWMPLSLITGGFICGLALTGVFAFAQGIVRVKFEQDEDEARAAEEYRQREYRHRQKIRQKRQKNRRNKY
jgi:hypothetical protein